MILVTPTITAATFLTSHCGHDRATSEPIAELSTLIAPLVEPNPYQMLENLLPHYVFTIDHLTLPAATASDPSARMVAMKNATDAANDLVDDLTLTYNQARQEAITKELLDIITAQSAFE